MKWRAFSSMPQWVRLSEWLGSAFAALAGIEMTRLNTAWVCLARRADLEWPRRVLVAAACALRVMETLRLGAARDEPTGGFAAGAKRERQTSLHDCTTFRGASRNEQQRWNGLAGRRSAGW